MILPIAIYGVIVLVLGGATAYLVYRDQSAFEAAQTEASTDKVQLLTTPVEDDPTRRGLGQIDHGFDRLIYQTGLGLSSATALALMFIVGLCIGGPLFVWLDNPFVGIAGLLLGMAVVWGVFAFLRSRRLTQIRAQLPEVVDLIARAVRAGESVDQAVEAVGRSFGAPLGIEFQRCARQLHMGLSMSAAMKALSYRAPITEVRILAATFNVQRRTGGNVAENLDRLAHVIRDRLSFQRQFQAATGGARLGTILIALAGPIVFGSMILIQPDYMGQFFLQPSGITWLATAIVLQIVGLIGVTIVLRNNY